MIVCSATVGVSGLFSFLVAKSSEEGCDGAASAGAERAAGAVGAVGAEAASSAIAASGLFVPKIAKRERIQAQEKCPERPNVKKGC